ncbi:MAG: hypothetical protein JWN12_281 [Candidatus Saccharibacteria bacterium]|nr:hypothetical protein [Candidatus Saccharibacteria bacterium]
MSNTNKWRPHTTGIVIGGLVLILVALVVSYMLRNFQPLTEVRLGSGVFSTRVAATDAARIRGLSGVDHLDANSGLLMIFQSDDKWDIWMKDMKIPLDIIWMNNDKKVIYIVTNASPDLGTSKTFKPEVPARYVLEIPAGTVKSAGIKIDTTATFSITEVQ